MSHSFQAARADERRYFRGALSEARQALYAAENAAAGSVPGSIDPQTAWRVRFLTGRVAELSALLASE